MLLTVKNQKGVTMIEVMVSIIILGMLMIAVTRVATTSMKFETNEMNNHKTRELYQQVTTMLTEDVKNAEIVSVTNSASQDVLTLTMYDGSTHNYVYDKTSNNFSYDGKVWFNANPLRSGNSTGIEFNQITNTVSFYLSIPQLGKPDLPFDLVVSPRYRNYDG